MITVHYFAGVRELTGTAQETVPFTGQTVEELQRQLLEKYPEMQGSAVQFAVNEEYALPGDALAAGDVIALIPPVSGG